MGPLVLDERALGRCYECLSVLCVALCVCVSVSQHLLKDLRELKGQFPLPDRSATWARLHEEAELKRILRNAEKWWAPVCARVCVVCGVCVRVCIVSVGSDLS